jgi:adenylate cyclase
LASLERDRVPSARPIAAKEVPLVDRTVEMNVLKEAVYRAVHGEGGLVFIHGEAGIGKTRLVRELGAYARSRGVQVLYGRCPALFRMDGVPPYIIWKEVIKDYLETCTPEQLYRVIGYYPAEVAKLVPEIGQKLRSIPQSLPISPEQEQNRLFEAVSQFITNISRETPLLVVLDDLQWTDPSSLLLLHYLARGVQKTPLLLLGAYRSTDIDAKHPLSPVLSELNREGLPESIHLKRMPLNDVSEMIKNILEQEDVPSEFCKLVYQRTAGNPFFVGEVVKSLKEEDVIYREGNKWKIKDVSKIEFPETVRNVVKARLSRLDDECQNVLTMASFVGNDFTLEAVCALTGIEENKLLELMEKLLKTGLVKHRVVRGEDVCSFADILVRDVVYEEVSPFRRKKLHNTVGNVLEKVYAKKIDEHLGELALHFLEGGDKDKALDYFLKAGEKAQKIYANNEAASYYQSALSLLGEKEGELREKGRVLEKLGDIKRLAGEPDASLKYYNDALLFWKQLDEKEGEARLHRKMSDTLTGMGEWERAEESISKASKILETMPESTESVLVYAYLGWASWAVGDMMEAISWGEKALGLAERLKNFEGIANSYFLLGTAFGFTGDKKKCIQYFEKGLEIALDKGHTEIALGVYNNLAQSLPAEEFGRHFEYLEKGLELAKKAGAVLNQSFLGCNLGNMYLDMGNMDKALALAEESVALDRKSGHGFHLPFSLAFLSNVHLILGDLDEAEQYAQEAFDISQKQKHFQSVAACYMYLGRLAFEKGEYAKAKESYEKACETWEKARTRSLAMSCSLRVVWAHIELGELAEAEKLLDSVEKFALEAKHKLLTAYADALRAMLLRAQKKWENSLAFFEKSVQEFEALNARRWYVCDFAIWVLCEYARVYLERDREGDREKARNLLSPALEIFQRMGAKKDIEKVEAKLLYIETGKLASLPKPTELVATGYADLDKLLCGGLLSSSAVVLTSPSCNERDSLIKSFLKTGAEKGEVTFYLTTNARTAKALAEEFQAGFYVFVCNPQADAIGESLPNVFKLKGVENLTDISIALTSVMRKLEPLVKRARRACIDIVSDALLQHHAVQTRKWLTALTTELASTGFTILAIVDPQMHPPEELHAILGLFDGEINIYEKGTEQFLRIKRMSNQKYLNDELLLKREDFERRG